MLVEEITQPNGRTQVTLKVELRGSSLKHSIFITKHVFYNSESYWRNDYFRYFSILTE